MTFISKACCALVSWAAQAPKFPKPLDSILASTAVRLIRIYQRYLSRYSGRQCLFEPSCSNRAVRAFRDLGFAEGAQATRMQLGRCGGNFTLCAACNGDVILLTCDGMRFQGAELAPAIRRRDI